MRHHNLVETIICPQSKLYNCTDEQREAVGPMSPLTILFIWHGLFLRENVKERKKLLRNVASANFVSFRGVYGVVIQPQTDLTEILLITQLNLSVSNTTNVHLNLDRHHYMADIQNETKACIFLSIV